MNGIVISSLDGGLLFYERAYAPNYGLNGQEVNSLQLSSSLYAVYRISQGESNESTGLSWIVKGNIRILFIPIDTKAILVTVFMDAGIDYDYCTVVRDHVIKCLDANHCLLENPMKPASKKALRAELMKLQISITISMLNSLSIPADVNNLQVIQLEPRIVFTDWCEAQLNSNTPTSPTLLTTPLATPSSKSLPVVPDKSSTNGSHVASSSSEKMLPPLVNTPVKPTRSSSFTQLFRRLIPRFDNRAPSPSNLVGVGGSDGIAMKQTGYRIFSATHSNTAGATHSVDKLLNALDTHFSGVNSVPCSSAVGHSEILSCFSVISDASVWKVDLVGEVAAGVFSNSSSSNNGGSSGTTREWTIRLNQSESEKHAVPITLEKRLLVLRMGDILMVFNNFDECSSFATKANKQSLVNFLVWSKGVLRNGCDRQLLV